MAKRDIKKRRISIDIDATLLGLLDRLASAVSESRNTFIVQSVESRLRAVERHQIDAAFADMAKDPVYRRELCRLEAEMAEASDAAWRVAESAADSGSWGTGTARKGRRRGTR